MHIERPEGVWKVLESFQALLRFDTVKALAQPLIQRVRCFLAEDLVTVGRLTQNSPRLSDYLTGP